MNAASRLYKTYTKRWLICSKSLINSMSSSRTNLRCVLEESRGIAYTKFHPQGEKLKHTIKRLRGQIEVAFNEPSYEKVINKVKAGNSNLTQLREQITALKGVQQP